jgi:hypothetical protein
VNLPLIFHLLLRMLIINERSFNRISSRRDDNSQLEFNSFFSKSNLLPRIGLEQKDRSSLEHSFPPNTTNLSTRPFVLIVSSTVRSFFRFFFFVLVERIASLSIDGCLFEDQHCWLDLSSSSPSNTEGIFESWMSLDEK